MERVLRIGNGAGFLGDWLEAPRRLVERERLDYLTLEYLAELTMSLLARSRQKDAAQGYAGDFLDVLSTLAPALTAQPQLKIVTNAGGVNPAACARAAGALLAKVGLGDLTVGVVAGDDLLARMSELRAAGCAFEHFDTGQPIAELTAPIVSANAYLGAAPIVEALASGAQIVITGRVADASLTVGPAVHEFGWKWSDWPRLAGASVAGHLIECGAQVTGGYSTACGDDWSRLADVGYPIAEIDADGNCVITKPAGSGGGVNRQTVVEQLVYEIGDPRHYLTPDVDVDFTTVEVEAIGPDRVALRGATGIAPPETYKVSAAYEAGYTASATLLVYGSDAVRKARACGEIVRRRMELAGVRLDALHVETLGAGDVVPSAAAPLNEAATEVMLRLTAVAQERAAVERFTKEIAPLITSGPPGLAGYAAGRATVRPVFAYWPTRIPRNLVRPTVQVASAAAWSAT